MNIEQRYGRLLDYWQGLYPFRNREDAPALCFVGKSSEWYPSRVRLSRCESELLRPNNLARYVPHAILVQREPYEEGRDDFLCMLAEEVAHAALPTQDLAQARPCSLHSLNGLRPGLGNLLRRMQRSVPLKEYYVDTNEFSAALFVTFLTGKIEAHDSRKLLRRFFDDPNYLQKEQWTREELHQHVLTYLPCDAAQAFLEHYEGNTMRFLDDHPWFLSLSGQAIWDHYCLPVLRTGEIPDSNPAGIKIATPFDRI